ncbi:MAG TPA: alpha/beta hydrolase [Pyrinomonadaceae bacterium]|nr:alpha/beta hydrolase [Pyrinomonadaceae bacterium]
MKKIFILALILLNISTITIFAQDDETDTKKAEIIKPKPDIADGKYGEFAANTFDLWKPKSKNPTPLVVFIHGGGLASGSKEKLSPLQLTKMLEAGFAVMAINYRLTGEAVFPQHYMDCARAIQYARFHAKDFNINPDRVGATGGSAGGMTSLWLGFHDDLADPKNADPILRESTRLKVMAVSSAQTTLVPSIVEKYVGVLGTQYNSYSNGKMFGLKKEEMTSAKALQLYKEISPLTYLTKDDPPVWAFYSIPDKPLTDKSTTSEAIHHPGFGKVLKEEMDKLKIDCKLRHKDDRQNVTGDMIGFLAKYLK